MKIALVCVLILAGCAAAWAYQNHRDKIELQEQCTALMAPNETIESKNDTFKTDAKTLNDEIAALKSENDTLKANTKTLNDEIAQLNDEIAQLKNAPPATPKDTSTPPASSISAKLNLDRLFK